jgi:hypothetical protein
MELRKKAMEMMMKDAQGIAGLKKRMPMDMQMEKEEEEKEGMEQILVTPEEKEMIMAMREKAGGEKSIEKEMMKPDSY